MWLPDLGRTASLLAALALAVLALLARVSPVSTKPGGVTAVGLRGTLAATAVGLERRIADGNGHPPQRKGETGPGGWVMVEEKGRKRKWCASPAIVEVLRLVSVARSPSVGDTRRSFPPARRQLRPAARPPAVAAVAALAMVEP